MHIYLCIYTWNPNDLLWLEKAFSFGGSTFKNRGRFWVPGILVCVYMYVKSLSVYPEKDITRDKWICFLIIYTYNTPWSRYMAQSPKGRWIQGLHKPIQGNCAIYFYPGVYIYTYIYTYFLFSGIWLHYTATESIVAMAEKTENSKKQLSSDQKTWVAWVI